LAAIHPVAGGAYTFGRREWHPAAGFVAGIGFVVGKTASVAAIALAMAQYLWPSQAPVVATLVIVAAWVLNARGVTRTAAVATTIAIIVVVALAVFLAFALAGADRAASPIAADASTPGLWGVAGAAGLVFFAFAGYARIATLGEEVAAPVRTIPRAIITALAIVLVAYMVVAATLLTVIGADRVATSTAPLVELVQGTPVPAAAVITVAATAAFGSLVALMAGVGRTAMAMARDGELPSGLARQGVSGAPWFAEGLSAVVAIALVWIGDLGVAIAMSSFAVLVYYAIANIAAARASRRRDVPGLRLWPAVSIAGAVLCLALAVALPWQATLVAAGALAIAVATRSAVRARTRARGAA
jgi:APA family basic amino acid/polyamine antiporter